MSLLRLLPSKNHCENPTSLFHTLDCEHVVKASSSPSTILPELSTSLKSPCSANCTRSIYPTKPRVPLIWLETRNDLLEQPFVCPVCVEEQVRGQYGRYAAEYKRKGGRLTEDVETNVMIWVYDAVLEAVSKGGRVCEQGGEDDEVSVFRIRYLEGFKALKWKKERVREKNEVESYDYGIWEMKDDGTGMEIENDEESARKTAPLVDMEMSDGAQSGSLEADCLIERLVGAKFGMEQDAMVDDIMEGISRL